MKISVVLVLVAVVAFVQAAPSSPRPLHDAARHSPQASKHHSDSAIKKREVADVNVS
ncbi:hypothetical protein BG004_000244, partial [Podila humilis]